MTIENREARNAAARPHHPARKALACWLLATSVAGVTLGTAGPAAAVGPNHLIEVQPTKIDTNISLLPNLIAPAAPTASVLTDGSVRVTWTTPPGTISEQMSIWRDSVPWIGPFSVANTADGVTITDLPPGNYTFRVLTTGALIAPLSNPSNVVTILDQPALIIDDVPDVNEIPEELPDLPPEVDPVIEDPIDDLPEDTEPIKDPTEVPEVTTPVIDIDDLKPIKEIIKNPITTTNPVKETEEVTQNPVTQNPPTTSTPPVVVAPAAPPTGPQQPTPGTHRFAADVDSSTSVAARPEASAEVSRALFPTKGSAKAVVISTSSSYADAIAGARLAAENSGPLLLTDKGTLSTDVAAEVQRVLVDGGKVFVLGGDKTVSAKVSRELQKLSADYSVERVAGADRYGTAVDIAEHVTDGSDGTPIYLASGTNYPDGLAVSALAARTGGVVLLTDGSTIPTETRAYLAAHDPKGLRTVPVGGPASAAVADLPSTAARNAGKHAVVGADRFDTAAQIAALFPATDSAPIPVVGLATGENWPDALVGSAAMGNLAGPLLLSAKTGLPAATSDAVKALTSRTTVIAGVVFGSDAALGSTASSFTRLIPKN